MKADKQLEEIGADFREVKHDKPVKGCEEAAEQRDVETRQIVKSLIIESEGEKYHVLLPGDRSLSEKKFGGEYRMVSPEESKEITGFESGTVHPFSTDLKHIVDERIFENNKVSHTVGEKTRGVILPVQEFVEALEESDFDFEVRDIAVSTDEDFDEIRQYNLGDESVKFVVEKGYRKHFMQLEENYDSRNILDLLTEFNRNDIEFMEEKAEEVLDRAENQTHMQRLVEKLAQEGELPEEKDGFDLDNIVDSVLDENPEAVEDMNNGKDSAINYLLGEVMSKTQGRAEASEAQKLLKNKT